MAMWTTRAFAVASAFLFSALAGERTAGAWYFPEHVVITTDAVAQLPLEVREILHAAVERARVQGVPLCSAVEVGLEDVPATRAFVTKMLRAPHGVDCVPLTALPALAADHADGTVELRAVLGGDKGRELTTAAAFEWRRFLETVAGAPKAPIERMSFVHDLDVDFYFMDPGYELRAQKTRAHFIDAGRGLDDVVRDAGRAGAVDNAVAQLLVHHLRSLELAARGEAAEALLEHGFALHFLQDAFAAGHLAMTDQTWARGSTHARSRHDFFDAKGLRVLRATSVEPCRGLAESVEAGLPPCWTTFGDGHLGMTPDSPDRVHVVRAVKKVQLQLAMALDPTKMQAFASSLGEREQVALGDFLDPVPWWSLPRAARRKRPATGAYAQKLVAKAVEAIAELAATGGVPRIDVGRTSPGTLFPASVAAAAVDPCSGRAVETPAADEQEGPCPEGRTLALGSAGASLLRPLLVELPAAEADVTTLVGNVADDHGLAFQLLASASAATLFPRDAPVDVFAPGVAVSMGIAYRFGTYLPGRRNRSAVELNAGIATALHVDGRGNAGGHPQVTVLEQEIRWPILWEGLTSYTRPLDLGRSHTEGKVIFLGGARVREVLTDPRPRFFGADFEVIALALSSGGGAYPLYSVSPEVRMHVGFAHAGPVQPALEGRWGPTLSLTFTGGYATLF